MDKDETLKDIYKVTRGQIEHNNNNIGQRVIWLVIAQSFFFGCFAGLICGNPNNRAMISIQHTLLIVIPVASLVTVVLSYLDIIVSMTYLKKLKRFYYEQKDKQGIENIYPPLDGFRNFSFLANASAILVPVLFVATWIFILIRWTYINR